MKILSSPKFLLGISCVAIVLAMLTFSMTTTGVTPPLKADAFSIDRR